MQLQQLRTLGDTQKLSQKLFKLSVESIDIREEKDSFKDLKRLNYNNLIKTIEEEKKKCTVDTNAIETRSQKLKRLSEETHTVL